MYAPSAAQGICHRILQCRAKVRKKVLSATQEKIIPRLGAVDELARHDIIQS